MSRALSNIEIQRLTSFVKKKVAYIDIQNEIVDHLACVMEKKMEQNPQISYPEALAFAYNNSFPNNDIKKLVDSKKHSIRRSLFNNVLKYLNSKMAYPGIILTSIFCAATYIFLNFEQGVLIAFSLVILNYILHSKNMITKDTHLNNRSEYLVEKEIKNTVSIIDYFWFCTMILGAILAYSYEIDFVLGLKNNFLGAIMASMVTMAFSLSIIVKYFIFPNVIKENTRKYQYETL